MMETGIRVLIVEDNELDAELIIRRMRRDGLVFDAVCVDSGERYETALAQGCDLILSDWSLPDFSGKQALEILLERELDIPFIIISGSIGELAAVAAVKMGAFDYILKDRPDRLSQSIHLALEQKRLRDQQKQAERLLNLQSAALNAAANAIVITDIHGRIEWVNQAFTTLTGYGAEEAQGQNAHDLVTSGAHDPAFYQKLWAQVQGGAAWRGEMLNRTKNGRLYHEEETITPVYDSGGRLSQFISIKHDITERKLAEALLLEKSDELRLAYDATLQGWSNALELRERETAGHSHRVVQVTMNMARRMGFSDDDLVHIQRGALLHDIGKMGIPDHILLKPGPLNDAEWEIMRQHPVYAYNLLAPIPFLSPALDIPHYHHEWWNGRGYPCGLQAEAIPLPARIFSVIDVWDALSYDRPYRAAWERPAVMDYLRKQTGAQFDPEVVEVFLDLLADEQALAENAI